MVLVPAIIMLTMAKSMLAYVVIFSIFPSLRQELSYTFFIVYFLDDPGNSGITIPSIGAGKGEIVL